MTFFVVLLCLFLTLSLQLSAQEISSSSSSLQEEDTSSSCSVHHGQCSACARAGCIFCIETREQLEQQSSVEASGLCQQSPSSCYLHLPNPYIGSTCQDIQSPHWLMYLLHSLPTPNNNNNNNNNNDTTTTPTEGNNNNNLRSSPTPRSPISIAQPAIIGGSIGLLILVLVLAVCCRKRCCCC
eukprot:GHVS01031277.1.p1 GENE.GHVS01031277.1~~GHVS01031277.1.p1  ORF type:complete len:212 (+),score=60.80 GHVS01031277.1:88-636(+)